MAETITMPGSAPMPLERPRSVEEVQDLVGQARAQGQAVFPVGGRTCLDLGYPPSRTGVALDLCGLDEVVDYPARDMTITVQAGLTWARLQETLAAEGQRLPVDVPLPQRATVGGAIASNPSGPRRYGFGSLRDYVIGISVVNDRGEVVKAGGRVVKNVAGYDLCKLYTGSLGTLGIIVQITLKVRPIPEASSLAGITVADTDLPGLLDRLHDSATRPCALVLLDPETWRSHLSLGGNGFASDWLVLVGYEDNRLAVQWQENQLLEELRSAGRAVTQVWRQAQAQPLWTWLSDWPLAEPQTITFRASVLSSRTADFCRRAVGDTGLSKPQLLALAGDGVVWGRLPATDAVEEALTRLRRLAHECGGTLVLGQAPPPVKERVGVWDQPRGDWEVMARVKRQLDPEDLFNPGRFRFRPPGSS